MIKGFLIQVFDASGRIVEESFTSDALLRQQHDERKCGAFCGYCYHEAMVELGLEAAERG